MCGKEFNFGSALTATHEFMQYVCGVIDRSLKVWRPRDAQEVQCVLNHLPPAWQKVGRLGLLAYKSKCLDKFAICEAGWPRRLHPNFLPSAPPTNNVTLGSYHGTCAVITFQFKNKTASNLQLLEVSCDDSSAPFLCEADKDHN